MEREVCRKTLQDGKRESIWIADAHRYDGKRFVVRADEKLTALIELGSANRGRASNTRSNRT
jgi:hypothetical protein